MTSSSVKMHSVAIPQQISSLFSNLIKDGNQSGHIDVIDVRAPCEYELDHFPGAINLPVLSDSQRHEIG